MWIVGLWSRLIFEEMGSAGLVVLFLVWFGLEDCGNVA